MNKIACFFRSGLDVLSSTSRGEYRERSEGVKLLRDEMLNRPIGSFKTDKENLVNDKRRVTIDVRKSFNDLAEQHG